MTLPIASALAALRSPHARQRNDRSVFAAQNVAHSKERLPDGLSLTWLGTAAFSLSYQGTTVLIDPYLSRPGLLATIGPSALEPHRGRIAAHVTKADAVLVGHTHFDHAMDVPTISATHGCKVYGSSSLKRLMALYGLADRAVEVTMSRPFSIGPFEVTFVESVHSKLVAGLKVPFEGELTCDQMDDLRGSQYRCGQVYGIHIAVAGVRFYHQGSADLLDDRVVHRGVDYFLAGIAGRGFTRDYVARMLSRLEPRVIIAHHFDDFFRPLEEPMGFSLNVNLGGFVEEVRKVSSDFTVCTMETRAPWGGAGPVRNP